MKKTGFIILSIIFIITLLNCATMFNDKKPSVSMNSDPAGAKVYINGNYYGETPLTINLAVKKEYFIEFRKGGYETKIYNLDHHIGGVWIVLDILGGFFPIIIDVASGAWWELDEENVRVLLEKK